jgi:hypothetical protein
VTYNTEGKKNIGNLGTYEMIFTLSLGDCTTMEKYVMKLKLKIKIKSKIYQKPVISEESEKEVPYRFAS